MRSLENFPSRAAAIAASCLAIAGCKDKAVNTDLQTYSPPAAEKGCAPIDIVLGPGDHLQGPAPNRSWYILQNIVEPPVNSVTSNKIVVTRLYMPDVSSKPDDRHSLNSDSHEIINYNDGTTFDITTADGDKGYTSITSKLCGVIALSVKESPVT